MEVLFGHAFPLQAKRETPKKARVFLFAEPLKILGKDRKNPQKKSKGNRKTKKARNSKKKRKIIKKKNKDWRVRVGGQQDRNAKYVFSERKRHINFFHINFLCRPSSPGLSQGQTGFVPGTNPVKPGFHCKIRRKPGLVPGFHQICPKNKPGEIPGTNPGPSQDQPAKKVDVYVPFSCLIHCSTALTLQQLGNADQICRQNSTTRFSARFIKTGSTRNSDHGLSFPFPET